MKKSNSLSAAAILAGTAFLLTPANAGKNVSAGQHINMSEGTPLANLWLTQARMMGVDLERFADSSGELGVKG